MKKIMNFLGFGRKSKPAMPFVFENGVLTMNRARVVGSRFISADGKFGIGGGSAYVAD